MVWYGMGWEISMGDGTFTLVSFVGVGRDELDLDMT